MQKEIDGDRMQQGAGHRVFRGEKLETLWGVGWGLSFLCGSDSSFCPIPQQFQLKDCVATPVTIVSTCEQGWCGAHASQSETLTDSAVETYGVYWVAASVPT